MGNNVFSSVAKKETSVENGYCCHLQYGSSIMQGWRRYQEDAMCVVLPFFDDFSFFAVYDGHGGGEVAMYLKQKLHKVLKSYLSTESPEIALQCAFNFIDLYLRSKKGKKKLDRIVKQAAKEESSSVSSSTRKSRLSRLLAQLNTVWNHEDIEADCSSSTSESEENNSHVVTSTSDNNNEKGQLSKFDALNYLVNEDLEVSDSEDGSYEDSSDSMQSTAAEVKNHSNSQVPSEPGKDGKNENEMPSKFKDEENASNSQKSSEPEPNGNDENEMETESESSEDAESDNGVNLFTIEPGVDSGSTVTVALVNPFQMFLANIGDSRCIISKEGRAINVSVDHSPDLQEELARIQRAACRVTDGRIDGILNLSRAIGDFHFKKRLGLPLSEQGISPEPYVASVDIDDAVDFIVLATDGIWNSLSSQEVCDYVNLRLSDANVRISDICDELCHHCIENYNEADGTGMDNMAVIIICPHTSKFASKLMKQNNDEGSNDEGSSVEGSSDEVNSDEGDTTSEVSTGSSDESTSIKRKAEIVYNDAKRAFNDAKRFKSSLSDSDS